MQRDRSKVFALVIDYQFDRLHPFVSVDQWHQSMGMLTSHEYYANLFEGFVVLNCMLITLKGF